ncbi:MAG: CvpA family protein [Streptococcaceae bacterium]|jgi:uncharacterized membrane protein required for colicin V production|nr:CvpA family protein [Streptococcaceae bacterium]
MVSIFILIILMLGFAMGFRRGLVLQGYYNAGTLIAYIVATSCFKALYPSFILWVPYPQASVDSHLTILKQSIIFDIDKAFYAGFAFLLLYFGVMIAVRLVGIFAYPLGKLDILESKGKWIAGFLGVCEYYLAIVLMLALLALIPMNIIQNQLSHSLLAKAMLLRTPIFSHDIFNLWVTEIIHHKPF